MRVTAPVARRILRLRYGINEAFARVARDKTAAALDRIEAELQPSGYLVGDRFSVADLTAAALVFQLVRPPEAPCLLPPPLPPAVEPFRTEASGRRAFEWVTEMYRRHRGRSAEIPGLTSSVDGTGANRTLGSPRVRFLDAGRTHWLSSYYAPRRSH